MRRGRSQQTALLVYENLFLSASIALWRQATFILGMVWEEAGFPEKISVKGI